MNARTRSVRNDVLDWWDRNRGLILAGAVLIVALYSIGVVVGGETKIVEHDRSTVYVHPEVTP